MIRRSIKTLKKKTLKEPRQGASTIEFLTAGVLLATVMTFLVPFVGQVATTNEEIADREWALREVRNLITDLQSGHADVELSAEATARLENPKLEVTRNEPSVGQQQKVSVSLVWSNRFHEEVSPVTLSFWESPKETP